MHRLAHSFQFILPVFRAVLTQPVVAVGNEQGINISKVAPDLLEVGRLIQRRNRHGNDVHEQPDEFAESGGITFPGELAGDAAGDFGNAGEGTNGVVGRA